MNPGSLADLLRLLAELKEEGVIEEYAVVGAIAALFYVEATPTFDLDVAVAVPQPAESRFFSLDALYAALRARGHLPAGPHILIGGVPVQFLPGDRGLWREVVERAATLDYDGTPVRVATAEHLVAMAFEAPEGKRIERARALLESSSFDHAELAEILARHGLQDRFTDRPRG
jgi:hypothetical protein